jgi:hypothetical protein
VEGWQCRQGRLFGLLLLSGDLRLSMQIVSAWIVSAWIEPGVDV